MIRLSSPQLLFIGCATFFMAIGSLTSPVQAGSESAPDLGPKWTVDHKVKSVVGPSVHIDDQGYVSLAWMEEEKDLRSVLYARSTKPGGPVGQPVRVNQTSETPYWRQESPALVVNRDEVYVTWALSHPKAGPDKPFSSELRLSRSIDGGRSFEPSVLVNDDTQVINHTFDALHRGPDGVLHFAWIDARDGKKESSTYAARSADRGRSVTKNLKVDEGTCVCCRTAMASASDGTLYLAWRKMFGDIRETVVARSVDGGETFAEPVIVGNDRWVYPSCPHRPASIGVDGQGRLFVVWYTEGADETPVIYLAFSDDRGMTFSPKKQLNVAKGSFPDHPQMGVDPVGNVTVIWEEQSPVRKEVVMSYSTDRGQTFSQPQKLNDKKAQTPAVAANEHGVVVLAWMEHAMPGHKMVLQTMRLPSTKLTVIEGGRHAP